MFENEYWSLWEESGVELPKIKTPRKASIKSKNLEGLQEFLGNCKRCKLCKERNKIVFGSGNPKARLMFIGEGPGADEDAQGLPFVGRAGHLLTKIIEAMGLTRNDVYIANIVKCRPPSNRVPEPDEIDQCLPFLKAQIDLVAPEMVVALGLTAARALTQTEHNMGNLRGQFHQIAFKTDLTLMPTYHPAYLLRNPSAKKIVWEDMKLVKERLGLN
ncbi:uracil-DNA glycosylase [bacterium]|nr:uracil-DNA glycosylase [bacterium]